MKNNHIKKEQHLDITSILLQNLKKDYFLRQEVAELIRQYHTTPGTHLTPSNIMLAENLLFSECEFWPVS